MSVSAAVVSALVQHSEVTVISLLGGYLAYEIRLGVVKEMRSNQRTIGVGLYTVLQRDPQLDEEAFRKELWDNGSEGMLPDDLNVEEIKE